MESSKTLLPRVRGDIANGALPPGSRLVEQDLADRYHVGRAVIRDLIVALESERLVERRPHRGATVRQVPMSEIIELAEVRSVIEGLVARKAAANATDADCKRLKTLGAHMATAVDELDRNRYSELNDQLHTALFEVASQGVATELAQQLQQRASRSSMLVCKLPGQAEVSLHQHLAIIDAVSNRDPEQAEIAMREHLMSVVDVLREWDVFLGS